MTTMIDHVGSDREQTRARYPDESGYVERDGVRVLDRRIALTPLRKLWIAWKTARRV